MKGRALLASLLAAVLFTGGGAWVFAQTAGEKSMEHGRGGVGSDMRGMMGMDMQGMMGMMNMMNSCRQMMSESTATGPEILPRLPAGNEKLQFQMHAEMMQKLGEIAAKYAGKIQESSGMR